MVKINLLGKNPLFIWIGIFIIISNFISYAQLFTQINSNLVAVSDASLVWGDYDGDEDLDLLLVGSGNGNVAKVYRNDGNEIFTDIQANLEGVAGYASWGDYDNDGDLDIASTGLTLSRIYRNDNGIFTDIQANIIDLYYSFVDWGDYDNDGDLDLLISGYNSGGGVTKIYRNENNTFTDIQANFTGSIPGFGGWGDYDNDGDLDILLTSSIFRNDGYGNFTRLNTNLSPVQGSAEWGDYDNDGYLDILLNGTVSPTIQTKVYRNEGNGSFVDISANLTGVSNQARWGDYDNDGDLDILLTGQTSINHYKSILYRNDGSNIFTEVSTNLPDVFFSAVTWGDYDNDNDLDIIIAGDISANNPITRIYRNDGGFTPNAPPSPPLVLTESVHNDSVTLNWHRAADDSTPAPGLTYNLRIGKTPNGTEIMSPMANTMTGFRQIVNLGNVNHDTTWTTVNLTDGIYYWSVQAIDHVFAGSPFASERTFTIDTPPMAPKHVVGRATTNSIVLSWDANKEPDIYVYRVYKNTYPDTSNATLVQFVFHPDTNFIDNDFLPNSFYYYWIMAVDSLGPFPHFYESNLSHGIKVSTDIIAPAAPSGLFATSNDTSIILNWDTNPENDLSYYKIYRRIKNDIHQISLLDSVFEPKTSYYDSAVLQDTTYDYWISAVDSSKNESELSGPVSSGVFVGNLNQKNQMTVISQIVLSQNYPNPFNPSTTIKYTIPKKEKVKIEVLNLLGQKIETLVNNQISAGSHEIEFNAMDLPSGVYLYRIEAGGYQEVKKMILLQ